MEASGKRIYLGRLGLYLFLFLLSLGCVARILPWQLLLAVVITGVWIADRSLFLAVDYSLPPDVLRILYLSAIWKGCRLSAGSWAGFWRARGNHHLCGRQPDYQQCACRPFAVRIFRGLQCLNCGTNLGGLGTLIASMASLISYKHIARMYPHGKRPVSGVVYRG